MRRALTIIALATLISVPALAADVPTPQVGKFRQLVRTLRGKVHSGLIAKRIKRASLAPPIERLLLRNVEKIKANGARHGTFDFGKLRHYFRVEAVGPNHRRSVSAQKESAFAKHSEFGLRIGVVGKKDKQATYLALTPNVTIAKVGKRNHLAIEHRDGKVTKVLRLGQGPKKHLFDEAKRLLEQGGLTLNQAMKRSKLLKSQEADKYTW